MYKDPPEQWYPGALYFEPGVLLMFQSSQDTLIANAERPYWNFPGDPIGKRWGLRRGHQLALPTYLGGCSPALPFNWIRPFYGGPI